MVKKFFLKIGSRTKLIKISPASDEQDFQCIVDAVGKLAETNTEIANVLNGSPNFSLLREVRRPKTNEIILVDLEVDDELEEEGEMITLMTSSPTVSSPVPEVLNNLGGDQIDLNDSLKDVIIDTSCEGTDFTVQDKTDEDKDGVENIPVEPPRPKRAPKKQRSWQFKVSGSRAMLPLPKLPSTLQELVDKQAYLADTASFYAFFGDHMLACNERPTKEDYKTVAKAVCQMLPLLKDDALANPYSIVSDKISGYIRSHRSRDKAKLKRLLSSDEAPEGDATLQAKKTKPQNALISSASSSTVNQDMHDKAMEALEAELQKKEHCGATNHIVALLKQTFEYRRKKISSVELDSRPTVVTKMYPHLLHPSLILNELLLCLQKPDLNLEGILENILKLMVELAAYLKFEGDMSKEDQQADFLAFLHSTYKPRNVSKRSPDLVTVKEVLQPVENELITNEHEGARLVMYTGDGKVSCAYLVADNDIRIKVDEPSVPKALACLIGCYYAWDKTYPASFKLCLNIFDEFAFGNIVKNPNVAMKCFRRDFKIWRAARITDNRLNE